MVYLELTNAEVIKLIESIDYHRRAAVMYLNKELKDNVIGKQFLEGEINLLNDLEAKLTDARNKHEDN